MIQQRTSSDAQPLTIRELKPLSFIYAVENALSARICRDMIHRFERSKDEHYEGIIGQMQRKDRAIKKSTDLAISGKRHWKDIDTALFHSIARTMQKFREIFPFFKGPFKDMGYAIQRTKPGEYYHWHIDGGSHSFSHRQLVAIWYLNDVDGPGGETEFLHQHVTITPEEGKLILFPPFWTHEHRGVALEKGVKYLATTWVVFA